MNLREAHGHSYGASSVRVFAGQVNGVTAAQTLDVARRYLVPERFVVIAVGDRAVIEGDLRALNLGDIEFRDAQARIQ